MASSEEDNNNNNNNDSEMGFQYRGEMSSGSMFNNKSSSGSGNLFGSGWDPLENLGELGSSAYPQNHHHHHQGGGLVHHYQSGDLLVPKVVGSFGSGSFSEMVNPFANLNPDECGGSSSPNTTDKRKAPHSQFNPIMNGKREERNDGSSDEKKQRIEGSNWRGNQMGKQAKENSDSGATKDNNYIHVRAKRGQATNSHSLAERVRRERISERMKLLQELVPGCNKITGKAVMLDEIINYVQSLQQQVEFLSMKLATVNPELNIDIDRLVFKDMVHSRSNPAFGYSPVALSSSHSYPHSSLPGIPTTTAPLHPIHPQQPVWDNDLHNLLQMGFDANLGQNGGAKMDV